MNFISIFLGYFGLLLLVGALLWAVRIFPVVKVIAKILKYKNTNANSADGEEVYEFRTRTHWWILTTDKKNRESVRYSSVYGSWLQLSNFMNVPVSFTLWFVKVISLYKGSFGVWLRSFKRTSPLKSITRVSMYQCTEAELRTLPKTHKLRPELENEMRKIVRGSIDRARRGDIASAHLLWAALINRPNRSRGFASFVTRIGILVGTKECHGIGAAVCKEMGFTAA